MGPQSAPIGDWSRKLPENAFCGIEIALNLRLDFFQNLTSKPHLPREAKTVARDLGALKDRYPEVSQNLRDLKFTGRRQRDTPVTDAKAWFKMPCSVGVRMSLIKPCSPLTGTPGLWAPVVGKGSFGANFFLPVSFGSKPKTAVPSSSNGNSPVPFCPSQKTRTSRHEQKEQSGVWSQAEKCRSLQPEQARYEAKWGPKVLL